MSVLCCGDEAAGPVGAVAQVARGRLSEAVGGQGDLRGAELHVVAPGRLGVERVGERGHQRVRRVRRRRPRVEQPRLAQLAAGPRRVAAGVLLGGQRERGRRPDRPGWG